MRCRGCEIRAAGLTRPDRHRLPGTKVILGHRDCDVRLCQSDDRRAHDRTGVTERSRAMKAKAGDWLVFKAPMLIRRISAG